jgi:NAD(P)H-dependent flavin oxidoreductase YrpB (nitropropane dioxygenase family)
MERGFRVRTPIAERLGIEWPIFGFSHCRDVVAAVSKAGGFGVLGSSAFTPEQLELELRWLDGNVNGRPYGVDVLVPAQLDEGPQASSQPPELSAQHRSFVGSLLDRFAVPELPDGARPELHLGWAAMLKRSDVLAQIDLAFSHNVAALVNALGPLPGEYLERAHREGCLVGSLAGKPEHALAHVGAGVDFIVAQGTEAAGHTGEIATMVLVPEVVDAVGADVPVLAAGGIGSGRQLAAAMALGAQGAWLGSIWLTSAESDTDPALKQMMLDARCGDTMRSKENSGKPCRGLRTPWREAWLADDSPGTLPMPLQGMLTYDAKLRIQQARRYDLAHVTVGQVVGRMNKPQSVSQIVYGLAEEYIATVGRMSAGIAEMTAK